MPEPVEIAFADIRQWDRIRTVRTYWDGYVLTFEGIAEELDENSIVGDAWRHGPARRMVAMKDSFGGMANADTVSVKFYLLEEASDG